MLPLLIAAGVGTGLSIYGQISAANSQADAMRRNAELKRIQADELLARQKINEQIILEQSELSGLRYGSSFASTGREGAGIGGILQIKKNAEEQIAHTRRDAEFKARMLRSGADIETELASDQVTAAWISGAGTLLNSGASAYSVMRGPTTPSSLGKV